MAAPPEGNGRGEDVGVAFNKTEEDFAMFPRKWIQANNVSGGRRFTVVSYNVLADICMPKDEYLYCPEKCRYMKDRHPRILAELNTMNADIVCLQEVDIDHWNRWLRQDMESVGYKGVYFEPYNGQGLAVLYKCSVFRLLDEELWYTHDLADRYIQAAPIGIFTKEEIKQTIKRPVATVLVKLQHESGDVISAANVHASWDGLKYPALQALQISATVNKLVQFAGGGDKPQIVCGDFNTPPDFPAYHMLTDGRLTVETKSLLAKMSDHLDEKDKLPAEGLTELIPTAFSLQTHLESAYQVVLSKEPAVTNCDDCGLPERTNLCLDYLWFSSKCLKVCGVLETPSVETITRHYAMPSILFPSDHLPIKAEFVFEQ